MSTFVFHTRHYHWQVHVTLLFYSPAYSHQKHVYNKYKVVVAEAFLGHSFFHI